jgi:hypothetical protein
LQDGVADLTRRAMRDLKRNPALPAPLQAIG